MAASIKIDITKHLKKVFLPDDWSDRIQTWIAIALQLLLIYVMINSLVEQNWQIALISLLVLTLTFLPAILERRLHVNLPIEFTLINCMFLYAAFIGYYYVKGGNSLMVNHLINRFIEKNPRLFHLNTSHNKER